MERTGERRKPEIARGEPTLAADLAEVIIDPPDRTFETFETIHVGGRPIELRFLGRGHTDHDAVITVPGMDVVWAGDLVENGALPAFGDAYPIDWAATSARLAALVAPGSGVIVPGHGDQAGRDFADAQASSFAALAELAMRIHGGEMSFEEAIAAHPFPDFPPDDAQRPLKRAVAQVRGTLVER